MSDVQVEATAVKVDTKLAEMVTSGKNMLDAQPDMRFAFEVNAQGDLKPAGEHRPVATVFLAKWSAANNIHSPTRLQEGFKALAEAMFADGRPVMDVKRAERHYKVIQPVAL